MVTDRIYRDLREHLDQEPLGFPSTQSGVEMKILQKLFTEEEAGVYINLDMNPEDASTVVERTGGGAGRVTKVLETLAAKGLVFRVKKGSCLQYAALPFALGSFEYGLRTNYRQVSKLFEELFLEAFGSQGISSGRPIRIVPVSKAVEISFPGEDHEDVKAIVNQQHMFAVSGCVCRVQQRLLDQGCDQSLEACLQFGERAYQVVNKGSGRFVTKEEALDLIDKCEEAGLVAQPFLTKGSGALCNCCGDCCLILRALKLDPKPAQTVWTDYYATVNPEACSACAACLDRCQITAIEMEAAGAAKVNRDRCIGCGLCVTTCPSGALSLRKKLESDRKVPAAAGKKYLMQLAAQEARYFIGEIEACSKHSGRYRR